MKVALNQTAVEALRWQKLPVLNDGFVTLVDVMGDDSAPIQAARVSYGRDNRNLLPADFLDLEDEIELLSRRLTSLEDDIGESDVLSLRSKISDYELRKVLLQEELAAAARDDETLLRYLMRHRHTTPFEMAEIKFLVRVPMDCWRQWIRHRTANVNEYSTRYVTAIDSAAATADYEWRSQSSSNKQGSSGFVKDWPAGWYVWPLDSDNVPIPPTDYPAADRSESRLRYSRWGVFNDPRAFLTEASTGEVTLVGFPNPADAPKPLAVFDGRPTPGDYLSKVEEQHLKASRNMYEERLSFNVAREQARKDLPLSTYTEAYWKVDLHNLFHFLSLRMDSHAQLEIRQYAGAIAHIVAQLFPMCYAAFEDYRLHAMTLSRPVQSVIWDLMSRCSDGLKVPMTLTAEEPNGPVVDDCPDGLLHYSSSLWPVSWRVPRCRERDETVASMKDLGLILE